MYFQVIMPIGANPDVVEVQSIIATVAKKYVLTPHFPRYATDDPVFNLQSTLHDLRGAEFVLADLSLERPSCYYELGLAEALAKPVFLVAELGTPIHQTASRRLVRFYRDYMQYVEILEKLFESVSETN